MLTLPAELRLRLFAEARGAHPEECCGLLEGVRERGGVRVTALHPSPNIAEDPRRGFLIEPACHFGLLRRLRGTNRDIVGCYHSHPNGSARPSERDRASLCEDGFVWVILAAGPAEVIAAYQSPDFRALPIAD